MTISGTVLAAVSGHPLRIEPPQPRYTYVRNPAEEQAEKRFNKKNRDELAAGYRTMRKSNPAIARLVYRRTKLAARQFSNQLLRTP